VRGSKRQARGDGKQEGHREVVSKRGAERQQSERGTETGRERAKLARF